MNIMIRVEYLNPNSGSRTLEVSRVPCVGEYLTDEEMGTCHEVRSVTHVTRKFPAPHAAMKLLQAIVRVI